MNNRTHRHGTVGRAVMLLRRRAARHLRWAAGRLQGDAYRIGGRHPAYDVPDRVLAERIRAEMHGDLRHGTEVRTWVEAREHVAYLRGRVADAAEAQEIEQRVLQVPGVDGVQSYLEIAPPEPAPTPSEPLQRMLAAARQQGCSPATDRYAVHAVLATFAARIPLGELRHVWSHLPGDVCDLLQPPVSLGAAPDRLRHTADFFDVVAGAVGFDSDSACWLTMDVLRELRSLVPEEAAGIDAVLPRELKKMWELAGAG